MEGRGWDLRARGEYVYEQVAAVQELRGGGRKRPERLCGREFGRSILAAACGEGEGGAVGTRLWSGGTHPSEQQREPREKQSPLAQD